MLVPCSGEVYELWGGVVWGEREKAVAGDLKGAPLPAAPTPSHVEGRG